MVKRGGKMSTPLTPRLSSSWKDSRGRLFTVSTLNWVVRPGSRVREVEVRGIGLFTPKNEIGGDSCMDLKQNKVGV